MNDDGQIYRALNDEIPTEDKARLDGYLTAKAEETERVQAEAKFREVEAEFAKYMGAQHP